jgi:hypothetical protein
MLEQNRWNSCHNSTKLSEVNVKNIFTPHIDKKMLTDFVCLYTYEFWLPLCKIARSSVILLLPLLVCNVTMQFSKKIKKKNYQFFKSKNKNGFFSM